MTDDNPETDLVLDLDLGPDFETEVENDIEADDAEQTLAVPSEAPTRSTDWKRVGVFVVLPALVFILGAGAGFLGWKSAAERRVEVARTESVAAARDATVALLSYRAETAEKDLMAALDRATGPFLDSYSDLVESTVIPAAIEKKISAQARVAAAASMSAGSGQAVVLVFVNQTITMGAATPTETTSSVKVTLDKVGQRWLVSDFDPV